MISNPQRDFYLSIDNTDPLPDAGNDWLCADWPDAPLPQQVEAISPRFALGWVIICAAIIVASLAYLCTGGAT